jgi:hypothetical protein
VNLVGNYKGYSQKYSITIWIKPRDCQLDSVVTKSYLASLPMIIDIDRDNPEPIRMPTNHIYHSFEVSPSCKEPIQFMLVDYK